MKISVIVMLAFMLIMMFIELPPLWKKKEKREAAVFLFLLLIGTGLAIAQLLRLNIPNPVEGITTLYQPVSDAINRVLE